MARRRPSAFEVSFPEESAALAREEMSQAQEARQNPRKRKSETPDDSHTRSLKRQELPSGAYYSKPKHAVIVEESADLFVPGEDVDELEESEKKPIRKLSDFAIFDPRHRNELVSLASMEELDGADRAFEAAGIVQCHYINDEDEALEEDLELENDVKQIIHLGAILRYSMDYTDESEPVYIETQFAWYILTSPSTAYEKYYKHFYGPRRIAQLAISWARKNRLKSYSSFINMLTSRVDMFGRTYLEDDVLEALPQIEEALEDTQGLTGISDAYLIKHLLQKIQRLPHHRKRNENVRQRRGQIPPKKAFLGNPDTALLLAENQNPTHVTPLIALIAEGFVNEELVVVGPRPPREEKALAEAKANKAFASLWKYIQNAKRERKDINFRKEDRITPRSTFVKSVTIDGIVYNVGDIIIVPRGECKPYPAARMPDTIEQLPKEASLYDFFWFAKIIYLMPGDHQAHIQWLEHGCFTVLEELAHPHELFYNNLCQHISLHLVASKIAVREGRNTIDGDHDYFVCRHHDKTTSSFFYPNLEEIQYCSRLSPPQNCHVCAAEAVQHNLVSVEKVLKHEGEPHGRLFGGVKYHDRDFVLYRSEKGPAEIGHIICFNSPENHRGSTTVTLNKVGRISSLGKPILQGRLKDEQHLFLTEEEITVDLKALVKVIFVFCDKSFRPPEADLQEWLSLNPEHFYLKYRFPSLNVTSWDDRERLDADDVNVCTLCVEGHLAERLKLKEFLNRGSANPLSTMDLFGGVGAFSLGLAEGSGCLDITHSVEISPSAAKTFKRNSPHTTVFNQCANIILRYAIKLREGHQTKPPSQLFDEKITIPNPPMPGEVQVITAGFPCQTHSSLNMFKQADDIKSNLILTALSYLDFYRPRLAYFENVPGFLRFNLNARQAGIHKVVGGVDMGGLKLMIRALLDMGYQVRYGLLQAGHYGTPQRRIRFFAIASLKGTPLPELPQPTHYFPTDKGLSIKLPNTTISPIRTTEGTAAHPFVTIEDAIGDLPLFDWKSPYAAQKSAAERRKQTERERTVPSVGPNPNASFYGFKGKIGYRSQPMTSYQARARQAETTDIQHFTRCLKPGKIERVLQVKSDYRDLQAQHYEWQFANPASAVARDGFRPGLYGRLKANEFFPTTVTNMDPTAKQSKVLHPFCKRMVTVRELARSQGFPDSFVFEAPNDHVITMHRQIGNAVPLPLARALGREMREALMAASDNDLGIY